MPDVDAAAHRLRHHRARRTRVRLILGGASAGLVALAAVWLVVFSPVLTVQHVRVDGATLVTPDAVVSAAAVAPGTPLAAVPPGAVAARVVAAVPAVASVKVTRSWPNTLVIAVTQRQIVYQVSAGGVYGWVSADGVVFNTTSDAQPVPTAQIASGDQTLLRAVATVVAALPGDLVKDVQSISATSQDAITLHLSDGRTVIWGGADQSDLKAQVITPLLRQPGTVYDVSAPSNPAVR